MEPDLTDASASELVARMLAGEQRAFNSFFEGYFPRLFRFALPRLGGDKEAAREVVQSTLEKAMRKLAQFRGDAGLFTWLCQICRHETVDYLRAQRRYSRHVVLIDDEPERRATIESTAAPNEFDLIGTSGGMQGGLWVHRALDRLPPHYADALEWKYIQGHSVAEIGSRLGIGNSAAQSLLARARLAFREALGSTQDPAESASPGGKRVRPIAQSKAPLLRGYPRDP